MALLATVPYPCYRPLGMAKIIKILSGRRWRTFARDIGGDARQRSPAEKLDELEVELYLYPNPDLTLTLCPITL